MNFIEKLKNAYTLKNRVYKYYIFFLMAIVISQFFYKSNILLYFLFPYIIVGFFAIYDPKKNHRVAWIWKLKKIFAVKEIKD